HVLCLGVSERHKAPVVFPSLVEDGCQTLAVTSEILKVNRANSHPRFSRARIYKSTQRRNRRVVLIEPPRVPIHLFGKPTWRAKALVIRRIVRGQQRGRIFESVDK